MRATFVVCSVLVCAACGPLPDETVDAGVGLVRVADAGALDAGVDDAGVTEVDAGVTDAGVPDAGVDPCAAGPRAGWVANLSTRFHGVQGSVTVTDGCTLTVSNFSYDGQGIDVRFVVTRAGQSFTAGTEVGPQLYRPAQPWVSETLVVPLPAGLTAADLEGISVWCVAASVDFGSGRFGPP